MIYRRVSIFYGHAACSTMRHFDYKTPNAHSISLRAISCFLLKVGIIKICWVRQRHVGGLYKKIGKR